MACDTIAQLQVAVQALVVVLTTCANDLLNVGANVSVGVEAQANIVACVAAIITVSFLFLPLSAIAKFSSFFTAPCQGLRSGFCQVRTFRGRRALCPDRCGSPPVPR